MAVTYRRDTAAAESSQAVIGGLGKRAKAYASAVENWADNVALIDAVIADFGSLGILVNNAGIASRGNSVADTDPAEVERVMRVHGFAPHYLSKLALPHLRKEDRSDIVMISSVATIELNAGAAPYHMGKALGPDNYDRNATSAFGRLSEPDDVAAAVTFRVSSANPSISGQKINIDGGGR